MPRPPLTFDWILTRYWRTIFGVVLGVVLGSVIGQWILFSVIMPRGPWAGAELSARVELSAVTAEWFRFWFLHWDAAFWTVVLISIAFGSVGLWLDIREARKWRNLERPEHQQAGVPSKPTDRHSRQWTRFRRPQGQQRPKR